MKVGITDVAAHAQVSEATVSRVINRRQGVSRKTREAVERAMAELGYERQTQGQLVAVVTEFVSNPFFADVAERIESALAPHGLKTVLCPVFAGGVQELDYLTSLVDKGIAAVVFLSSSNTVEGADTDGYELLRQRRVPYVGINGEFADGVPAPVFSTDDALAAELAVDHLHRLGHRRIGMASGPSGNRPADRRVRGFVEAMARRGIDDAEGWVVRQSYSVEGGQAAAGALVGLGATAIVAASDFMALGAVRGIRRQGLSVPDDVSVVGYDGSSVTEFTDPALTTVRQPADRLALEVGRSVLALVGNREVPTGELLFDPELVIRASTGPAAR
ncbi:LacI family transcriptional regulator [Streptomyces tanashiensis]|uniref:LacI family transcriptional regulator n=1 Tax=Streptomyces tanashiensis TaxID=67367 RepID=A0ABY6R7Z6_9ACTN|nr:LacI family DNA-binding transcriptional regulator [Streptomyces tanashiensis]UZX25705.1 LacI family transcriptional regulator [Streptomyces tanashiensis]GGS90094.1 LacI family transcriptional regulator [Streptomyces tanashiensis]GGY10628.1 LacI family transcriptional regulator [Streptomyces tanashiensis]